MSVHYVLLGLNYLPRKSTLYRRNISMNMLLCKQIDKRIVNMYCWEHNVCSWVPLMYLWPVSIELLVHVSAVRPLEGNAREKKQEHSCH